MKRITVITLGWIARVFGIFITLITLLFLVTGELRGAGMFAPLGFALLIAGSNLLAYGKRKDATDTSGLPKE
jgi:hypothetical protein